MMRKYAPTELLVEPVRTFLNKFVPCALEDKFDEKYPKNYGYYAYKNLNEYVAERGTYLISQDLISDVMKDKPVDDSKYTFISPKGECLFEFEKEKTQTKLDKLVEFLYERQKVLKAIWNGDIDTITAKENRKFIKEIK